MSHSRKEDTCANKAGREDKCHMFPSHVNTQQVDLMGVEWMPEARQVMGFR